MTDIRNHADLIWRIAELLRGDYKRSDYGKVILPMVVMRRLDQVMEPTRDAVIAKATELDQQGVEHPDRLLLRVADQPFYNVHKLRFRQLLDDPAHIDQHLRQYIDGYSTLARRVIDYFEFDPHIEKLKAANLLYKVIGAVCDVDLHPDAVSNAEMGAIFEELIRRFAEASNETAGEHFTPREVVRLMVNLLLNGDEDKLTDPGARPRIYDCACGTGGMLSEAQDHIRQLNPDAEVLLYGQELNPESYAICLADLLVKSTKADQIAFGNTLSADQHETERFDYCIANPPFGVDWTKVEEEVREEHAVKGFDGRFGPGLPRKSDGQLLFLMHLLSKRKDPDRGGTRIAIVHNGSPLFTGGAGSSESEIRRWILENDWLEAIVALPEQLFYNTGIATYVWVLCNRKPEERAGKVQLIDAREKWVKMRKALGEKRRLLSDEQIDEITRLHGAFAEGEHVKIVDTTSFGYRTITVEQPLRARWEIAPETWAGLDEVKALAKLNDNARAALASKLAVLGDQQFDGEDACRTALRACAIEAGITKPSAALVKALVARCLVRDPEAPVIRDKHGDSVADPELSDTENVPLMEDVEDYLAREVHPWVPDAWCPDPEGRIGYEIPFTRLFYKYTPPRPSQEIKAELRELEGDIRRLLLEVVE